MPKSATEVIAIVVGIGMAVAGEAPSLISAIEDLSDDDKRNDAAAGLEIHAIAGRITDRIVAQFPNLAGKAGSIAKMHAGLSDLLEGALELADDDDGTPEGKTRRRRRRRRSLSPLVGARPMMRVDR